MDQTDLNSAKEDINIKSTGDTLRILHIDDDEEFLFLTKMFLEQISEGKVDINYLTDPEQALDVLDTNNFDVIVCDYQMPRMDGLELLSKLKTQKSEIPFIMFTGRGREEVAIRALNLGAEYYIKKEGEPESQFRELYHIIQKVVDHKRIEKDLKTSERRFREFAELLPETVFEIDKEMNIIFVNNFFLKEFGYELCEINKGVNALQLVSPEYHDSVVKTFQKLINEEYAPPLEILALRKDGSTFPSLTFSNVIIHENQPVGLRGIMVDISQQKQHEKELLEGEKRFRTLFEENPVGVLACDLDGNIDNINKYALGFLGSPSKEETKKINLLSFPLLMKVGFSSHLKQCITKRQEVTSEVVYTSKWGKTSYLKYKMVPFINNGEITQVFITFVDISAYKEIENELKDQKEELKDFASFLAHDIANSLTIIEGYANILDEDYDKSYMKKMLNQIEFLREFITSSFDFIQMEHKIEKKEKTDLNELVEKIVKLSIPDSIVCNLEKLPEVICDSDKLSRALKNLLDNAVIHANPKKIEIKKRIIEEKLEILIINDGDMIPEENLKRIFEKGFSTKGKSGFGLRIAKKYVEAHGWELRLETTDKTTSFIISIPQN